MSPPAPGRRAAAAPGATPAAHRPGHVPLIAIAGLQGSGKTTVAQRFASQTLCVHVDRVLAAAARAAFPYLRQDCLQQWGAWPRRMETMRAEELLADVLVQLEPTVRQARPAVLLEGVVLSQDWFREPLVAALTRLGHPVSDASAALLRLEPPADAVHAQILARSRAMPARRGEADRFPDVQTVVQRQRAYASGSGSPARWEVLASSEALGDRIAALLGQPLRLGDGPTEIRAMYESTSPASL